jgi:hypothetical protein
MRTIKSKIIATGIVLASALTLMLSISHIPAGSSCSHSCPDTITANGDPNGYGWG